MIPLLNIGWNGDRIANSHESDVLSLIEKEELTLFTFDGLKRRLGLHPETLSRVLSRLEQGGLIRKEADGYRVTPSITKLKSQDPYSEEPQVPLLQTYLPSNVQTQQLIINLKGKWFGSLRWLGISQDHRGVVLKWVTEDGGIQINAVVENSALTIEARFLTDDNLNRALTASYQLITYIGKYFSGRKHTATHVDYYGNVNAFLMSA